MRYDGSQRVAARRSSTIIPITGATTSWNKKTLRLLGSVRLTPQNELTITCVDERAYTHIIQHERLAKALEHRRPGITEEGRIVFGTPVENLGVGFS
jgi:hypothetical protein